MTKLWHRFLCWLGFHHWAGWDLNDGHGNEGYADICQRCGHVDNPYC